MSRAGAKNERALQRALALITEALDLLDAYEGPPQTAAHLSIVQEQLRQVLKKIQK